jgi:hypothetical protein
MRKPTIYEALAEKLGREPTHNELVADVKRILFGEPADVPIPANQQSTIFRDHNCWKCRNGEKPCAQGHPHRCEHPHAKND